MPIKLLLDPTKISQKEFEGSKPGYDALQVDSFLDIIIKDYEKINDYVQSTDEQIQNLSNKVDLLTKTLSEYEAKIAVYEQKIKDFSNNKATLENIDLLKRISALEKALSKVGINPSMIK